MTDSKDVFDVRIERARRRAEHAKRIRSRQANDCIALLKNASAVTPDVMFNQPTQALQSLLELARAVDRQMLALSATAFDTWRASARAFFKTDRLYTLAYVDPPWNYDKKHGACGTAPHYETMSDDELAALPVRGMMHENSVIAMWATAPKLDVAKRLLTAWGYEYKTVFLTWVKVSAYAQRPVYATSGAYTKPNCEYLLLGVCGNLHVLQRTNFSVESVLETRRSAHSQKPSCVRQLLVAVFGDRPRIELFARETEVGWDAWGNEVGKFDHLYDNNNDDDEITPIRPGRTRVNNLSAKPTKTKRVLPIAIGRKDVGSTTVNTYYNKPAPGTSMTKSDFALHGACATPALVDELKRFSRIVDIRAYFDERALRKQFNDHRHPLYTTMTNGEARTHEEMIKRVQDHSEEVLAVINAQPAQQLVKFSDTEIADLVTTLAPTQPSLSTTATLDNKLGKRCDTKMFLFIHKLTTFIFFWCALARTRESLLSEQWIIANVNYQKSRQRL